MGQHRTDESPFQSRFGGGWISSSQYLAESMCDRKARSQGKSLPIKFWETTDTWKREFLLQVRHANTLLKLYSVEAIIKSLRKPGGKKIYSFAAKWLDALVAEEQRVIDLQKAAIAKSIVDEKSKKPEVVIGRSGPRPEFVSGKTSLSKLRDLDR